MVQDMQDTSVEYDGDTLVQEESDGFAPGEVHPEEEWEDFDEANANLANPREKSPAALGQTRVRRRKPGQRTIFVAQPNNARKNTKQKSAKEPFGVSAEDINQAVVHGASATANYFAPIIRTSLRLLRYPLTALVFMWMLSFLMSYLSSVFASVFSPMCYLPGTSRLPMCNPISKMPAVPKWADYPKLMEVQGSTFEQLLDSTVGSSELSLEVKKAEMATSDLVTLVKVSNMKTKDLLSHTLEEFVSDAKKTGRGLQKLSSKIAGAVDSIVAVNDHALHTIEASGGKSFSALSIIWPFSSAVATKDLIRGTFSEAMGVLANQMSRVILEAEVSLANLESLDERLQVLHELVSRENKSISAEKEDLLAELWTILGGNKRRLKGLDGHLFLLRNIGEYRKRAQAHVIAALQTLQGMSEDMEDLRERTAAPELVGERIPVEVHIKSIKAGLERLTQKRIKAQEREEEAVRKILGVDTE